MEIKDIELSMGEWLEWYKKLQEELEEYIFKNLGMSKEQLGEPGPRPTKK